MKQMFDDVRSQISTPVFIWVNVMSVVILASAVFMFSHFTAALVFASAIASLALATTLYRRTRNIYALGAVHIPLWTPLLVFILWTELPGADFSQAYTQWLAVASAVMAISLVFDLRDAYQVFFEGKGRSVPT